MQTPVSFFRLCAIALLSVLLEAQSSTTVNVQVGNAINTSVGVNGRLEVAMSTSFQLASFSYGFFNQTPQALGFLNSLGAQRTRFQMITDSVPLTAPGVWNFSEVNALLPPV